MFCQLVFIKCFTRAHFNYQCVHNTFVWVTSSSFQGLHPLITISRDTGHHCVVPEFVSIWFPELVHVTQYISLPNYRFLLFVFIVCLCCPHSFPFIRIWILIGKSNPQNAILPLLSSTHPVTSIFSAFTFSHHRSSYLSQPSVHARDIHSTESIQPSQV